ncbi:peptide synthetase [Xylogone sp. PMI_703]|nr:peptide synthetase [Xylogone sp. PMI_703]
MAQVTVDRHLTQNTPAFTGAGNPHLANGDIRQQRRLVTVALRENVANLQAFCRKNNVQLPSLFKAAWALVLGRYLGAEQVVFTSIVENGSVRTRDLCQSAVDETATLAKLLKDVESELLNSKAAEEPSNSDEKPLLNSCVQFEANQQDALAASLARKNDFTQNVVLLARLSGQELSVVLNYSASSVLEEQALNIASTFETAVSLMINNTKQMIGEVELISERDLAIIWGWNKAQPRVVNECVQDYIARQVAAQPEAQAVDAWDGSLTYRELDEISTRLAHHLVGLGVGPEIVVPLCFEKSKWAIVAFLAVPKAGGAVVFIDPSHPQSRREEVIGQIGATLIVTSPRQSESWAQSGLRVIVLEDAFIQQLPPQTQYPKTNVKPTNVLYVIFTSGSTGKPKGCVVEHLSFCSGAVAQAAAANMNNTSRILQLASYSFDVSVLEILTALMHGACICTPSEESMREGIAALINKFQISWAFLTPSLVKVIAPTDIPGLKTLILGGEALSKSDVETWAPHVQLGNGYGPSECSVAAAGNPGLSPTTNPANIGRAIGGLCWIVDADDHNKLIPVGAVGELLIEGPIVARGYLNNPEKTAEVFVQGPAWGPITTGGSLRRLYKTGDLARYNPDGTIHFIGRKDTQVKLRGLRIELGEIEHHISVHDHVQHAIVLLPKAGHFKQHLVVVLSLKDFLKTDSVDSDINLLSDESKESAEQQVAKVKEYLAGQVPYYMVPETWVLVDRIPLMLSGKMARAPVLKWITDMDEETYHKIAGVESQVDGEIEMTENEAQLRQVYSDVLNLPIERIPLDRSFLSLGGDSISAMQVMSRCRAKGMAITVKDIIRRNGISELALYVASTADSIFNKEESFDTPFELSPVQRMYFEVTPPSEKKNPSAHYNQSFFLRLTRPTGVEELVEAFEVVVAQHSMLRARIIEVEAGKWQQYVMKEVTGAYDFRVHEVNTLEDTTPLIAAAQGALDLFSGPVFAAHLFNVKDKGQFLFLVAHHAIIDLVSWRVIMRDLEDAITTGQVVAQIPLPYQTWLQLQAENARDYGSPRDVLPFEIPRPDIEYWGMVGKPNKIRDTREDFVKLDADATARLMGTLCHDSLRTEPIDLIMSVLMYSFSRKFSDRVLPTIFREGHGREPWSDEIDISETVGWFTTMFPLCIDAGPTDDVVEFTRRIKDNRRAIPLNGRPYFASRFLNEDGVKAFGHHTEVEICFDYLGLYQQLEKDDALLRQETRTITEETADIGPDVQRFALMEITAEMINGQMQFSFVYNRMMKNQEGIQEWIRDLPSFFVEAMDQLTNVERQYTLSDFPMLTMTYNGLEKLLNERLPEIGVTNPEEVQDIYPCSPMQQGLLISQNRGSGLYEYSHTLEVVSKTAEPVNIDRLKAAWQKVVQRHSALRTVFFQSVGTDGVYDQLVLKNANGRIASFNCEKEEVEEAFKSLPPISFDDIEPPHRFSVCQTSTGQVLCKLEFNHTIVDGASLPVILQDFILAYDNMVSERPGPLYGDYISYLQSLPKGMGLKYWKEYLKDLEPTYLPLLEASEKDPKLIELPVDLGISPATLQEFCAKNGLTLSNIFQVAWGLVLRAHTGLDDVSFGYLSSGREAPVAGIESAVGPFITMLVCRLILTGTNSVSQVLQTVQEDFLQSLPHQHCSLADIQHVLNLSGEPLFNTVMSFQKGEESKSLDNASISIDGLTGYDPTEYNMSVDVMVGENSVTTTLGYWTSKVSNAQAQYIAGMLKKAVASILKTMDGVIDDLDLVGDDHMKQIMAWNSELPTGVIRCVHDIFEDHVLAQPNAPAICSFDGDYTYAELDAVSTKLAHHLVGLGVGPEVFVPFCFHKSSWTIITLLAIVKAGGACVPLDPAQPLSRLKTIINTTGAKLVVVAPENASIFNGVIDVYVVDPVVVENLPTKAGKACTTVRPDNAMYTIFSSGTTGVPKGIVLEHYSVATFARGLQKMLGTGPGSRVLQFAAYTYDVSIGDIFGTLMLGACICNISDHDRMNNLTHAIQATKPTVSDFTATVASLIKPDDVPSLKVLSLGGEAMTKEVLSIWADKVNVCNVYGPAECSVTATYKCNVQKDASTANVGYAVECLGWVVDVNDHNKLTPIGCIGELAIEGPLLARGYLNDPVKTQKAFIEDPAWSQDGSGRKRRFYKTGDLVRYNADGSYHLVGRSDTQVKLYGQRVELTDIESHIVTHMPGLQHVTAEAVTLRGYTRKSLAMFFVANSVDAENALEDTTVPLSAKLRDELRALQIHLSTVLPSYMVPSMYIALKQMPLNASGKLNRSAIRQIAADLTEEQQLQYSLEDNVKKPPTTAMEMKLQKIWSDVLGIPTDLIGVNDSFLRLGGDSVVAMRLVAAARAENLLISVANVFKSPELSNMALTIETTSEVSSAGDDSAPFSLMKDITSADSVVDEAALQCQVEKDAIEDIYPCTPLQEGLLVISTQQPGAYVARTAFILPSSINLDRFRDAWNKVVALEPILRTRIVHTDAGSLQVVLRNEEVWRTGEDLDSYLEADKEIPIQYGRPLHRLAIIGGEDDSHFVWTVHHALYDGWSQGLIFKQVELLYMGESVQQSPPYSSFIQYLNSTNPQASEAFWQSQLKKDGAPTSFPQLPTPSYKPHADQVHTHTVRIPRKTNSKITNFTIMKAAWTMVVSRYSNSDDIIFAMTLSGRTAPVPGITDLTGPTITTVPLRVEVPRGDATVNNFLEAIQDQNTAMMPYEHTGLQNLRKYELDLKHLFVFQPSVEDDEEAFMDLESVPMDEADFNTYALVMQCSYEHGRVIIEARYDGTVIDNDQMKRILFQYEHAIRQLTEEANTLKVEDVELFSPQDLELVQRWNGQKHESMNALVHEIIGKQVLKRPVDAHAVCSWDGQLTYRDLDTLSSRLAAYLINIGVGPEVLVPICFDKSAWTIVTMIAILKAGGAYVPLSPAHPLSRLMEIIDDVDAKIIVAAPQHAKLFKGIVPTVVTVDPLWLSSLPVANSVTFPRPPANSPAFLVFTSGSTGKPKGVVLEHRTMATMAHAEGPSMQFNSNTRVLNFAASTFDVCNSEILTTLMFGGCVCIPSEAERMNDLMGVINRWEVNWLFLTPAMADILDPATVPTLKTLALGGEAIRQDLLDRWADKVYLINSYGPSETTIWTSNSHLLPDVKPVNIGRGYGCNTWVTEISDHNRLAPVGCIGELLVEGPILARCYIKNPEKTAAAFIIDPLWAGNSQSSSRRFYKTGDLVKYNSDGTMDYVGRKDTQVKLRGQRIELGEIEHHTKVTLPDAQQVVADVILLEGRADDRTLAAFLELTPEVTGDSSDLLVPMSEELQAKLLHLQSALGNALPPYMIPSLFIILKSLPRTGSGKLDRKELRSIGSKLSKEQLAPYSLATVEKRAPSTDMERKLQGIWANVLHVEASTIGADDSFFQSGGDSIGAMKLVTLARSENLLISVADIFKNPRLSEMAKVVQGAQSNSTAELEPFSLVSDKDLTSLKGEAAKVCNIKPDTIEDIYPCTPLQEGLLDIAVRNKGAYVAQNVFHLPKTLDINRFKASWQKLADKHAILRTRITETGLQVVVREQITWQTGSTLDLYLKDDSTAIRFGGPLCFFAIVEGHFVWTAHHAVYDAWSIGYLFEQLETVYNGTGVPESVPYNKFIEYLANIDQEACDAFWEAQLSGDRPASFPEIRSLEYRPSPNEATEYKVTISHNPKTGILMSTILQAAWGMVVSKYSDADDVVFAMALSGRNVHVDGIETVMGPTITSVPVRMRFNPEQPVAEYLESTQNQATEMIPFAHAGLQNILKINKLKSKIDLKHLFVVQTSAKGGSNEVLGMESVSTDMAGFDSYGLVVECVQSSGEVEVQIRYDTNIISGGQIMRMIYLFEHLMRQFNDGVSYNKALKDVDLFSPQDAEQVAVWNSVPPVTKNECVHELVHAQVLARSQEPAVLAWDGNFTYTKLDMRSTQLAHHLISLGVGPEVLVPLVFDKSSAAIVAMLAILKAGGACVALNPDHPPSRLHRIIEDAEATVIVASSNHAHLFEGLSATIVTPTMSLLNRYPRKGTFTAARPENPAFVVFTSGSTGTAKGIMLEHSALCSSAFAHGAAMRLDTKSRVLQFAAYTFDVSIGEIFTTLIHGGCVCVPSEHERMNDLAAFINRMNVNWAYLTPTVASLLNPTDVPTLKTLSLGGEALTRDNVSVWADKLYLINIYGPAETTIWSTALCGLKPDTPASNLGYGCGGLMWVAEVSDHNRLAPIGCVGELLIEGPILARGYVKLEEKTKAAFITDPTWAKGGRRFYKTGDLVKYNPDGTIDYVSRKDTQFKLHGQRIEASEIEHHLSTDSHIRHSMILLPKSKSGQQRLTAILSLESIPVPTEKGKPQLMQTEAAEMEVAAIRTALAQKVPSYMVPSIWLVVDDVLMTVSGKMNRLEMKKWVERMDEDVYGTVMDVEKLDGSEIPATEMEEKIQKILSQVLNIPIVRLNRSFLSLGGDSITAMQTRTKCQAEGISISIQEILRSKSISQLALAAKSTTGSSVSHTEALDTLFDLAPIQSMYFDIESKKSKTEISHHLNQSFLLRIKRRVGALEMSRAIEAVVGQHSMLRARFEKGSDGKWMQRIVGNVINSYGFRIHQLTHREKMMPLISVSETAIDIVHGPVFSADLFNIGQGADSYQLLFVCAHHLVIDLVSWRTILHDLEEVLESGRLSSQKPLSFQGWSSMTSEYIKSIKPQKALPISIVPADFNYWGMGDRANIFEDQVGEQFSLDSETTDKLFGVSNETFRTEPVDIILAALTHSFGQVFPDRQPATIYNEGHGRESWDSEIDAGSIVGWFTTLNPLYVPLEQDILETLKQTKDLRRQVPNNGFSYFCSRFLSAEGREAFGNHKEMEILFNYQGRYQQLEKGDSLIVPEELHEGELLKDQGSDMERFALFEIGVEVVQGKTTVSFAYNRQMHHLDLIKLWIQQYSKSLKALTTQLAGMEVQLTLGDFPLLSFNNSELQKFQNQLSQFGISPSQVEDAYPTAPMQRSMLLTQKRIPGTYEVQNIYDVLPKAETGKVDISRLQSAWQKVVDHHVSLRTIFVPSVSREDDFDQVVLERFGARMELVECSDEDISQAVDSQIPIDYQAIEPHNRFTIFSTPSKVACKIEISHALSDGVSMRLLVRDLSLAYEDTLPLGPGPRYRDFISFLQQQSSTEADDYWKTYLKVVNTCHLPHSKGPLSNVKQQRAIRVTINENFAEIQAFCKKYGFTVANLFQAAWGLVLRHYTGQDNTSYGYLTSGRDIPVEGVTNMIGTVIHMLVYRQDIDKATTVSDLLEKTKDDFLQSLPHQYGLVDAVRKHVDESERSLFNTLMSLQYVGGADEVPDHEPLINFENTGGADPNQYDLSVGVNVSSTSVAVYLGYWTTITTDKEALEIAQVYANLLTTMMAKPDANIVDLKISS